MHMQRIATKITHVSRPLFWALSYGAEAEAVTIRFL